MNFKEKLDLEKIWYEKILIINLFHTLMLAQHKGKWSVRKTAKYFGKSAGLISEDIRIADKLDSLKDCCKSRTEALIKIGILK